MSSRWTPAERRWRGLEDGVLAYALAALRTLWVWPLLRLIERGMFAELGELLTPLVVFGLLGGGTLVAQCGSIRLKAGWRTSLALALIGLVAAILVLYFSVGRERAPLWDPRWLLVLVTDFGRGLFVLFSAIWLWWWGLLAGRSVVAYESLARNFALGLAALLLWVVLGVPAQIMPATTMLTILLAFLALGLFTLALSSIQEARRYESARADYDLPLARLWWGTVGAIVAVLLLAALLLSRFFVPETLAHLAAGAAAILAFLGQVLTWLLLVISYPLFTALEWLMRLLGLGQRPVEPAQLTLPPSFAELFGDVPEEPLMLRPDLQAPLQIAGGVLLATLIVLLFALALRRLRVFLEDDVAEARESILSLDLLKAQLAGLLRRRSSGNGAQPAPFVALAGEDPATRVRRTYQALLAWAAAGGIARPRGMTPDRYQRLLSTTYPQHAESLRVITAAYGLARYGAVPVSEVQAGAVAAAWQQICASSGTMDA